MTIDLRWTMSGLTTVVLENRHLKMVVLPEVGARIDSMICKRSDRDLLFHHPRVEPRPAPFGAPYDMWWSGGIDEGAPTGHACQVDGIDVPSMGELWSLPWTVEQLDDNAVKLSRAAVISPLTVSRTMRLESHATFVSLEHELTNTGASPMPLLWGMHPTIPIGPSTTVRVPSRRLEPGQSGPGDEVQPIVDPRAWAGERQFADIPGGTWSLDYACGLEDGWVAVEDAVWNVGFAMIFPAEVLPSVWLWAVDGGWRDIRCIGVEPWTGHPARLDAAIVAGNVRVLAPGEVMRFASRLVAYEPGAGDLEGFDDHGIPIRR